MPLFPAPTSEDIIDDSRLRSEQVSARFVTQDVIDDVEGRLPAEIARVEIDALNSAGDAPFPLTSDYYAVRFPNGSYSDENTRLQTILSDAAKKLALYDLFISSGQLQKSYPERAQVYKADYDELMKSFADRMAFITGTTPVGESGGNVNGAVSSSVYQEVVWC